MRKRKVDKKQVKKKMNKMISEKRSAKEEIKQDGLKEGYADVNWVARKGGFFFFFPEIVLCQLRSEYHKKMSVCRHLEIKHFKQSDSKCNCSQLGMNLV